jgi:hypothetical protein
MRLGASGVNRQRTALSPVQGCTGHSGSSYAGNVWAVMEQSPLRVPENARC